MLAHTLCKAVGNLAVYAYSAPLPPGSLCWSVDRADSETSQGWQTQAVCTLTLKPHCVSLMRPPATNITRKWKPCVSMIKKTQYLAVYAGFARAVCATSGCIRLQAWREAYLGEHCECCGHAKPVTGQIVRVCSF